VFNNAAVANMNGVPGDDGAIQTDRRSPGRVFTWAIADTNGRRRTYWPDQGF
jgi:hypothetical protein